jgi:hypothetical protein
MWSFSGEIMDNYPDNETRPCFSKLSRQVDALGEPLGEFYVFLFMENITE